MVWMRYFSETPDKGKQISSYDLDLFKEINEYILSAALIFYNHPSALERSFASSGLLLLLLLCLFLLFFLNLSDQGLNFLGLQNLQTTRKVGICVETVSSKTGTLSHRAQCKLSPSEAGFFWWQQAQYSFLLIGQPAIEQLLWATYDNKPLKLVTCVFFFFFLL